MKTLKALANKKGFELRHCSVPLAHDEKIELTIKPFDFSECNGGTVDGFKYYNDHYLYPCNI
jgi:hypothetical protein